MNEFELKFQVPAGHIQALIAALGETGAKTAHLRATYFDTEGGSIASHGASVRLRREGRGWTQTAKARGPHAVERLEHEVSLGRAGGAQPPALVLERHAGTPAGDAIAAALDVASLAKAPELAARFDTDVVRMKSRVTAPGCVVEIALDRGRIVSGEHSLAICEVEFELVEGDPLQAVKLVRQWRRAHGLWLDVESKAARGRRLLAQSPLPEPQTAAPVEFARKAPASAMVRAVVRSCLDQVLANASAVANGGAGAEHIHQLRVGLRRLRTALRELVPQGTAPKVDPLVRVFRLLGRQRDLAHCTGVIEPMLRGQGAPEFVIPDGRSVDVEGAVRSGAFQDSLLAFVEWAGRAEPESSSDAREAARQALHNLHGKLLRDAARYLKLDTAHQHRVRKRLKRLRYLAEFAMPLYPKRQVRDFIEALKPAQDALGEYNDELAALASYREWAAAQPAAWFGAGWLAARREANAKSCQRALGKFARREPFWE